jgi:[acyl-carrier-protein] S-malonyltransferase
MSKSIWVFPGQGSQAIGMGQDLRELPGVNARLAEADSILGWSVMDICNGDAAILAQTVHTQPCLYVIESLLADQLKSQDKTPDYVAGHSLGEYAALYTAGVFDFATGLRLIQQRAQLMDGSTDGMMAALLGADREQLEATLSTTPDVVLANDNNAGQVVISGTIAGVEAVMAAVKSKKAVKLNVSGAFHSPLMASAAAKFGAILEAVSFQPAQIGVLSNVDPLPSKDADLLKARLTAQMTGSVRWRELTLALPDLGVTDVLEVGPGKVLAGIMKRTCADLQYTPIGTLADLIPDLMPGE